MFGKTLYQTEGDFRVSKYHKMLWIPRHLCLPKYNTLPYLRGIHNNKGIVFPITNKVCTISTSSFSTQSLPLQKWICAACVQRLWCSECCTCASCTYVQNMCKLLPYLIYAQHVCYLLAHMHATGMLHKCLLYACMLLQYCIHAAYTHASY